ncbi:1322_t:CDS:2 [Cetraspora pellucida]|uniref:1322_t:CDS:1 n=1 Tax=Cetraspora pellucida TaxID=1433469 RepID=A0A9N9EGZ6_9GLOM|nr:1322_t:CDS:2 [Cetraspora pellucida]
MNVQVDIGPLVSHCLVTYKNSIYIFGGTIGCSKFALTNFFHYATPPFSQGQISWQPLSTENVKSVTDAGCIVDETRGLFFVIGGRDYLNNTCPGIQIYDFNTQRWNDPQYSQNFIPNDFVTDWWGPRAVWLQPGLMFMWGANSTTQGSYLLDINVNPWQWTILSDNKSNIVPTKCAGVVAVKGNAFIFGGFDKYNSINPTTYIYSPRYGFIIPQFQLPIPFNDGVVGVWNNKLTIIMMDTRGTVMQAVNFDLKTFKFDNVISASYIQNITTTRNRGYGVQFLWSDSIFIYGGTAGYCSQPLLDTWVVYNMSSQRWETNFSDKKSTNFISNDLSLPKVNDLNINNEDSVLPSNGIDYVSYSTNDSSKTLIIIIIILSLIILVFSVTLLYLKRLVNRYKGGKFQISEISSTRVVD